MWSFGWWTTGRDQAAIDLFETVHNATNNGIIPGEISYPMRCDPWSRSFRRLGTAFSGQ